MLEQGRSTLVPDDSGRTLDRLAGLEQVISDASVRQALLATGRVAQRACKLTHEVSTGSDPNGTTPFESNNLRRRAILSWARSLPIQTKAIFFSTRPSFVAALVPRHRTRVTSGFWRATRLN